MQPHLQLELHKSSGNFLFDPIAYKRLIGRLMYLTYSRPKISYAVSKLNQFIDALIDEDVLSDLLVLKYTQRYPWQGSVF